MKAFESRHGVGMGTSRVRRRTAVTAIGIVATVVGVGACGASSSAGPSSTTPTDVATTPASSGGAPTASYSWSSLSPADTQAELDNVGLGNVDYSVFKGKKIGVAELAPIEPVTRIDADFNKCIKANGGTETVVDVGGDPTKSTSTVQTFIQSKVAAIYNDALDPGLIGPQISNANKAHIPIITAWSGETPNSVGINGLEFQSAARLAQYMLDRIGGAGDIAMVESTATASLRARDAALVAILKAYPNVHVVSTVQADVNSPTESGNSVTKSVLQAHSDVKAIWTDFDGIGEGAAQAVKAAGSKAFVVSFNGDSAALDLLREPTNPFAATMANDLEVTGDVACAEIANMLNGNAPPAQNIYMDSPLVTKDNVPAKGFVHGTGPFLLYTGPAANRWPSD